MLKLLYLRNFRNYTEASVRFSAGINAICGPNAQGKTNLLEAIHVLMTGRSFRTSHLSDLIKFGETTFYLEAHFLKNGIDQVLKISCDGLVRKIILNTTPLPTLSALLGILVGVILSPEDSELIKGHPACRRQFLDLLISKASPLYVHHLSRYLRAMKHRNTLLKRKEFTSIGIWEEEMAISGAYVIQERKKAIEQLNQQGHPLQKTLSGNVDELSLSYKSSVPYQKQLDLDDIRSYLLHQFERLRHREAELGSTLTGPHKDDLIPFLQDKEARLFASEGQQRSCIAALRLAEWNRLKHSLEENPLMCIDDVGISLDSDREKSLYEALAQLGQVFITSPREDLPLPAEARKIFVKKGHLY